MKSFGKFDKTVCWRPLVGRCRLPQGILDPPLLPVTYGYLQGRSTYVIDMEMILHIISTMFEGLKPGCETKEGRSNTGTANAGCCCIQVSISFSSCFPLLNNGLMRSYTSYLPVQSNET